MSDTSIDGWLPYGTLVGTPDQVYAYGIITLTYNRLEDSLIELFATYLPISPEAGMRFGSKLTNSERIGLLIDLIEEIEQDEGVKDCVHQVIRAFNICSENRNILAHGIRDNDVFHERIFVLRKWASGGKRLNFYDIPIETLRQVALDMQSCLDYLVHLLIFMIIHRGAAPDDLLEDEWVAHRRTLPDRPPRPSKLIPRPPGVDHEGALRLAQPFDPSPQSDDQA